MVSRGCESRQPVRRQCWRRNPNMTEQRWNTARQRALHRIDRSERRFRLFVILLAALEMLFLWGFVQLAEFSNRVHVLIFWSTVSTYAVLLACLAMLWGHI